MARVLVTGATGFIGKQLVGPLCERGDEVFCLVRPTSRIEPVQKLGARFITGDITEPQTLPAAVANVDVVYHLAGLNKAHNLSQYNRVNETGVQNVLEACARRTTPPAVILLSSLSAAGPMHEDRLRTESDVPQPVSSYGRSKRAGEIVAESLAGEVPITVLRPPVVFGPGDVAALPLFRGVKKLGIHVMLGLGKRVSLIYVGDLVTAIIDAAQQGQRLPAPGSQGSNHLPSHMPNGRGYYFVAAEEHPSYSDLGQIIGRAMDRQRVKNLRIPQACVYALAAWNEMSGRITRRPQYLDFDRVKEIKGGHWLCSSEKARHDLSFSTSAPLEERFRQTAHWYQQTGWL